MSSTVARRIMTGPESCGICRRKQSGLRMPAAAGGVRFSTVSAARRAPTQATALCTVKANRLVAAGSREGRGSLSTRFLRVRTATESDGVVAVVERVRDRPVRAAVAMQGGVEPVAALEGAIRIGRPLMDVADHVVEAEVVDARGEGACLGDRPVELDVARIVELEGPPAAGRRIGVIGEHRVYARVVAASRYAV